jgi:signal peptidase I
MRKLLKVIAWVAGIFGAIFLLLYATIIDIWTVPEDDPRHSVSIEPTLSAGDHLVVLRSKGDVKFGHLVRCADPDSPGRFVVGRVYGTARDKVKFENDIVLVNGKREPSPRACDPPVVKMVNPANGLEEELHCFVEESAGTEHPTFRSIKNPASEDKTAVVEQGRIYLVSDNRHIHLDSRDYGTISPESCQHVVLRLWGKNGFGDSAHRFNVIW